MSSALSGMVNQSSAYVAGGVVPHADGQQPPEPVPLRAAALRRRRADHHRRQQRPVPQAGRGARRPRARRRPALLAQRGPHRQPRRAAAAAGRAADDPAEEGVVPRDHRRRRAVRADQRHRRRRRVREEVGLDPVVEVGEGDAMVPSVRNPITFSETPADYLLPPPGLDEHGDEIRAWLSRREEERPHDRRAAASRRRSGTSTADEIRLLGQDLAGDLMGKVGFGELAFWLVALRRPTPARPGSSRRCWSRWPTTASRRPRSRPGSPTSPRPTRCRARWPPGCSVAARGSSA